MNRIGKIAIGFTAAAVLGIALAATGCLGSNVQNFMTNVGHGLLKHPGLDAAMGGTVGLVGWSALGIRKDIKKLDEKKKRHQAELDKKTPRKIKITFQRLAEMYEVAAEKAERKEIYQAANAVLIEPEPKAERLRFEAERLRFEAERSVEEPLPDGESEPVALLPETEEEAPADVPLEADYG